ncbi:recombinase family protein [Alicyclobacillus dauci]|uniref:Recombinase family protein n=1 Tax=Alicyclobacillus dauci TaxID=1475485 RepID=A0ABY6Z8J3_9BACL|nr:recombinase family protein [Alicyclobacillus dauci]WAH38571.1 recombinase family protein [Alicyclobacillus dauci]
MRAAIYTRVSSEMQVADGFSLDAQLSRLRSYCDSQGWTVAGVYTDEGISAKDMQRPSLNRLVDDIKRSKYDVVVVYKLDRLTRSVRDLDELLRIFGEYKVGFKSATEVYDTTSATGRLFLHLVASLAQWERETIAERVRFGQEQMTHEGKWSGGNIPFGYDHKDGKLVINDAQAIVVREIYNRYVRGEGTKAILTWLNDPEHPQLAPNRRWSQWGLKYLLRNPLYAGYVRYGYRTIEGRKQPDAIIANGEHEAIITQETWERADQMRKRRTMMPSNSSTGTYPLSGLLRCGKCGTAMSGRTNQKMSHGKRVVGRHYICNERQHSNLCDMPMIQQTMLEDAVLVEIEKFYESLNDITESVTDNSKAADRLNAEIEKVNKRRSRWMDAFEEGNITSAELRERLDTLNEQEEMFRLQLSDLEDAQPMDQAFVRDVLKSFRSAWDAAEPYERKELIRIIVKRIDVHINGKVIRNRPAPFRVDIEFNM